MILWPAPSTRAQPARAEPLPVQSIKQPQLDLHSRLHNPGTYRVKAQAVPPSRPGRKEQADDPHHGRPSIWCNRACRSIQRQEQLDTKPAAAAHRERRVRRVRSPRWILRPVRATVPLWREPPCRGGLSRHDAAGAPWRRFADGPARGAYGRAWSGVSAGAESPAGDPPPPTAGQPSWLKCLRIESSQVRTVACAFVVMRSMMASARIFSSMRSCHWLGGSWVQ